jgi:hypothetical protein
VGGGFCGPTLEKEDKTLKKEFRFDIYHGPLHSRAMIAHFVPAVALKGTEDIIS